MKLVDKLRDTVISNLGQPPEPEFQFEIGWCKDYTALFEGRFESETPIGDILQKAVSDGRVLVCGRGGSAKTVILDRLVRLCAGLQQLPIRIDLKLWSSADLEGWLNLPDSHSRFVKLLETAGIGLTLPLFAGLPPDMPKVLFVDGLNELQSGIGEQIIRTLDAAVTEQLSTSVVVSDRLVRRDLRAPHRWKLCTVLPLTEDEIRKHLQSNPALLQQYEQATDEQRKLWTSPLFLDGFLRRGEKGATRSAALGDIFMKVPLQNSALDALSAAAFMLYRRENKRTFRMIDLENLYRNALENEGADAQVAEVFQHLRDADILRTEQDYAYFAHHLLHDYLSARFLSSHPSEWNQSSFDAISFSASSFDALSLVLEQITTTDEADRFARELFDWNPYAAAYCLAEQRDSRLSPQMEVAMCAMIAEKKFDLIDATRERAEDALRIPRSDIAKKLSQSESLQQLFSKLHETEFEATWFRDWRALFTTSTTGSVSAEAFHLMQSRDSIIGWTVSNVLKRTKVSADQVSLLKQFAKHRSPVVRWRAIHTLGAFPSLANHRFLIEALVSDPNHWVRFGAVRSLIEMAALAHSDLRSSIFLSLTRNINVIADDPRRCRELESAVLISGVKRKPEWIKHVDLIMERLWAVHPVKEAKDHIDRFTRRFRQVYAHSA